MIALSIDKAAAYKEADRTTRLVLRGALDAVKIETRGLEQDLEKIARIAVPGRLWRGFNSKTYPKTGVAKVPVGEVFFGGKTNGRSQGALAYWTQEGRISRGGGRYLAVPTKAAGGRGFGTGRGFVTNSPKELERRLGTKLHFRPSKKPGGHPVLVLENARVSAKTGRAKPEIAGRKNVVDGVVMFVLIPFNDFKNAFAIEPVVERRRDTLPATVERSIQTSLARP